MVKPKVWNVTKLNYSIKINDKDIYLNKDVLYAVYYTVGAYALCKSMGVSDEELDKYFDNIESY